MVSTETIHGTFTVPILDDEIPLDPSMRPYMVPPMPKATTPLAFPLKDFRSQVFQTLSGGDYTPERAFLNTHGFTAVKHNSSFLNTGNISDTCSVQESYYPEIASLVKDVVGCKEVIVMNSAVRSGVPPENVKDYIPFKKAPWTKEEEKGMQKNESWHKVAPLQPIRLPHCDSTAMGGRQSLRFWQKELTDAAERYGVLKAEEEVEEKFGLSSTERGDQTEFENLYNDHENVKLGPRYAFYSIWRPLKPVTRDPLALIPWSEVQKNDDFVLWPYENRVPGYKGDWKKELAMLKVKPEALSKIGSEDKGLQFWYISEMQRDEVLFVTMFNTAGLGKGANQEVGCLHGSPDLGEAGYGEARESIEVKCMAFW
ncbi:hypothetical protein CB0940_06402 [Cercospora beticola]|uniref:GA4 desaturase n=1 Tax=Cercospora beticola TaxID=122368 RepID=A0A2G5I0Y8_CERBT|nr:hypothetical protein CB0940_06402 [Cercospora beticola]PIA98475.1 hypothetical protein CB0940_06402 [Cercospora beticola]WPA99034.1 hypothetical protein RHO25_003648 [Cercospora beticola]CAK1360341.1 unnamed protein product [Cercospora beticola]